MMISPPRRHFPKNGAESVCDRCGSRAAIARSQPEAAARAAKTPAEILCGACAAAEEKPAKPDRDEE